MKCEKCGVELIEGSEERFCYDCKQKKVNNMKKVGIYGAIGLAAIGIIYGVSPIDFIPDLIPGGIGLIDDLVVGIFGGLGTLGAVGIAIYNTLKEKKLSEAKQNQDLER